MLTSRKPERMDLPGASREARWRRGLGDALRITKTPSSSRSIRPSDGIVKLIKNWPKLVLLREAKPLKMHMATTGESPQFRCKSD